MNKKHTQKTHTRRHKTKQTKLTPKCFDLKELYPHSMAAASICSVAFIPTSIASYIFTELSVTLVGCVYPVYRATKAVCTPDEGDDKEWLQYWMLGGVLFCLTTWM